MQAAAVRNMLMELVSSGDVTREGWSARLVRPLPRDCVRRLGRSRTQSGGHPQTTASRVPRSKGDAVVEPRSTASEKWDAVTSRWSDDCPPIRPSRRPRCPATRKGGAVSGYLRVRRRGGCRRERADRPQVARRGRASLPAASRWRYQDSANSIHWRGSRSGQETGDGLGSNGEAAPQGWTGCAPAARQRMAGPMVGGRPAAHHADEADARRGGRPARRRARSRSEPGGARSAGTGDADAGRVVGAVVGDERRPRAAHRAEAARVLEAGAGTVGRRPSARRDERDDRAVAGRGEDATGEPPNLRCHAPPGLRMVGRRRLVRSEPCPQRRQRPAAPPGWPRAVRELGRRSSRSRRSVAGGLRSSSSPRIVALAPASSSGSSIATSTVAASTCQARRLRTPNGSCISPAAAPRPQPCSPARSRRRSSGTTTASRSAGIGGAPTCGTPPSIAAGFAARSPYQLRHTFAAFSLRAGVPISDLAREMGHANVEPDVRERTGIGRMRWANAQRVSAARGRRVTTL